MRKRSKEIPNKNREKFADLIVVLGIKYDEFIGKLKELCFKYMFI